MNTKSIQSQFSRIALLFLCTLFFYNCSNSEDKVTEIADNRSFIIDSNTDFFVNKDGTINLILSAVFNDQENTFGTPKNRGFVYSTTSKAAVGNNNAAVLSPGVTKSFTGYINNLPKGKNYFIRGYFEMSNGSYFYGNEIQASTNVDAVASRTITLEVNPLPFFKSKTEITPEIKIYNAKKELPIEIGFEYSVNNDFSNSTKRAVEHYKGAHVNGVLLQTKYASEVISGLTAATTYFFRPYAKYNDNTVTNGGTNSVSFTTNN